jgi:hypothetical protein
MITSPNVPRYRPVGFPKTAIVGFLCLALIKIWLTSALRLNVAANSDEVSFLVQAHGLLAGHWLGGYTGITLVKMPFYSMFLALCFLAGIPVLLAQQLIYVVACALFLVAIRPAISTWHTSRLLLLYAWLAFNPMSFLGGSRLLRNHLYASLGVLLIASALAIVVRLDWDVKPVLGWTVLFGIVLSAQWLTREESSWVLPFLLVQTLVAGWLMWRSSPERWRRNLVLLVLPYILLGLSVLAVNAFNKKKYGIFAADEFQSRQFSDVMGALYRVDQRVPRRQYVVVPKETRQRIYEVSPAFAELKPSLEGALGQSWAALSCQYYEVCTDNDVVYGWFVWEIRGAAGAAGHGRSAVELAMFFKQIAKEINAACASGKLFCQEKRSSTIPPWDSRLAWSLPGQFWRAMQFLIHFHGFSLQEYPSQGTRAELAQYRDLSRESNITSAPRTLVAGWAIGAQTPLEFSVRDSSGQLFESSTRVMQRPDVFFYLKSAGRSLPSTVDAGFEVETSCISSCSLYIRTKALPATGWMKVVPLDENVSGFQSTASAEATRAPGAPTDLLQGGGMLLYIDKVTRSEDVDMPLQTWQNSNKLKILERVGALYQKVSPTFCALALLIFLALLVQCWRYRTLPVPALMICLILVLLLSRTALLAFVDVFAMRIFHSAEYTQYNYPLLLMAVGLLLLDPAAPFRVGRTTLGHREQQASRFSAAAAGQTAGEEPSA